LFHAFFAAESHGWLRRQDSPAGSEADLTARHKLNAAHVQGAIIVAGILGALTESLLVFLIALAGLLIAAFLAGDIRR